MSRPVHSFLFLIKRLSTSNFDALALGHCPGQTHLNFKGLYETILAEGNLEALALEA